MTPNPSNTPSSNPHQNIMMDQATARNMVRNIDSCTQLMQKNIEQMQENVKQMQQNVEEMQVMKEEIEASLQGAGTQSNGSQDVLQDETGPHEQHQTGSTSNRPVSIISLDSNTSEDSNEDEPARKRPRIDIPGSSNGDQSPSATPQVGAGPSQVPNQTASQTQGARRTEYGTELRVSMQKSDGSKLEDQEFSRQHPGLWAKVTSKVKRSERKNGRRVNMWIRNKSKQCMHAYVTVHTGVKDVKWQDQHPHKVECEACKERNTPCLILNEECNELIFLPPRQ
ncbi:uncharacterized protein J3D65DRAFT_417287 [Phyllosticta citribraziliensis]|uniref:Uncharacterized protein n=1 Tax=Phyllosticta citribraziliensis TaxID=989973 RepID=A0ABR1LMI8_9PEZI